MDNLAAKTGSLAAWESSQGVWKRGGGGGRANRMCQSENKIPVDFLVECMGKEKNFIHRAHC